MDAIVDLKKWARSFLVVATVLLLLTAETNARSGSRGGSRFRSSRTSSSGSSTRINGLSWRSALTAGTLYGSTSYMRRSRYRDDPDDEPEICHNIYDYQENFTTYDYFICPLPGQPEDYLYCCGDDDREHCCKFFDDPGRIAGVVIGILVFCVLVTVGGVFLFKKCRS